MARIPYLSKPDVAPEHQDLLARDINLYKALIHSPGGARAFNGLGRWIRFDSSLDPRLRELAIVQVGYLTRSEYEYSHHVKIGRDFGLSDADIRAVADETHGRASTLGPLEQLVLRAAREMTTALRISDDTFAALREHLDDERMVELSLVIGFYNGVVRVLATLGVDVEPDYAGYLREFPLD